VFVSKEIKETKREKKKERKRGKGVTIIVFSIAVPASEEWPITQSTECQKFRP
jgi:hypothetical protein